MIAVSGSELKIIKSILQANIPDCKVKAFGSRINGTFKHNSDLDLAVIGKSKLGFSNLPFRVDVLDYNSLSQNFRNIIDKNYELLHFFNIAESGVADGQSIPRPCRIPPRRRQQRGASQSERNGFKRNGYCERRQTGSWDLAGDLLLRI
jgi:predicted nucleotidyltransferase